MPVFKTARFQVRRDGLAQAERAIREFVEEVKGEPGTRLYLAWQEKDDPTRFLHVFVFENEAAEEWHASSEAVRRFTSVLYPRTVAPVELTDHRLVASTS